jgi:hypothetical protein
LMFKFVKIKWYEEHAIYLGTVAHTCNPSYSGGRDQKDRS